MYYARDNNIGIRRKFAAGNQVLSFGGKKCRLSKEVLWDFGCMCLKKLDAGETEKQVKTWVDAAIHRED